MLINGEYVSDEEFNRRLYKLYHSHEDQQQQSTKRQHQQQEINMKKRTIRIPIKKQIKEEQQIHVVTADDVVKEKEKRTIPSSSAFDTTTNFVLASPSLVIEKQPPQQRVRLGLNFDDNFDEELNYQQKLEATKKKIGRQYQMAREAKEKRRIRVILNIDDLPPLPSDSTILSGKNKRKRSHGGPISTTTRNNNRLLRV